MRNKKRRLRPNEVDKLKDTSNLMNQLKKDYKKNNPDVIEYNGNKMIIKQIEMNDHAYQRASERFNLNDKGQALGTIRSWLKKATLIGETASKDGNKGVMFAYDKREIILSPDLQKVYTVNKQYEMRYQPAIQYIIDFHKKEFRKLSRQERAKVKHLKNLRLESDVELAELKLKKHRTKSVAVENACIARIQAINKTITEYDQEIKQIQSEKRRIARSMVSLM